MNREDIVNYFNQTRKTSDHVSEAVCAIKTLIEFIKLGQEGTLSELLHNIKGAIEVLKQTDHGLVTSIASGCNLFVKFITLHHTALDNPDFAACKEILVKRGEMYLEKVASSRKKIANFAHKFIHDGATILTHSRSRVVLEVLREAAASKKRFTVYVTESLPDKAGSAMHNDLQEMGIPSVLILDAAVGYILEKVDLVLVGAEGVVESGGIINKIGTYTMAISAKAMNKPFYVVAESFKFARLYPLNQQDVPNQFKYKASALESGDLSREHPLVDYTPPSYLTLLFTDLGILTPSAVSDELIKLYL